MRTSLIFAIGTAFLLAPSPLITAVRADPAYFADKVIEIFVKDKAAKKTVKTRAICIGTAAECQAPQAAAPAQFDLLVTFEFDSAKLTKSANENLDEFAKALRDPRLKGERFEIDGHTDATGAEDYNLSLSERRADAVISYLTSQGLDPTLFVAKGFGKTKPRAADPYSPENRRVETHLLD